MRIRGELAVGREAIARQFQSLFDERKDLRLTGQLDSIRFILPCAARVTGHALTVGSDDEPLESTFHAILVCDGEHWRFDSIEESPLPTMVEPDTPLAPLELLVGRWIDENDGSRTVTNARWGANRSFLVRSYTIDQGDDEPLQGTQVIGWDPRLELIRCWMFDSDGSFGEGTWSTREDGWAVKFNQTLADGTIAGATQVITVIDQNTLNVQLVGQEMEGVTRPSAPAVRVVRDSDVAKPDGDAGLDMNSEGNDEHE